MLETEKAVHAAAYLDEKAGGHIRRRQLCRLLYLCAAAVLGLFGIIAALLLTLGCLAAMQNYGAPYFAPYAPRIPEDLGDGVFKTSPLDMKTRPLSFPNFDRNRQKEGDER